MTNTSPTAFLSTVWVPEPGVVCADLRRCDDGLEFFGGTVNVDHCVVVDCTDDSFDWTEGWSGTATNLWLTRPMLPATV